MTAQSAADTDLTWSGQAPSQQSLQAGTVVSASSCRDLPGDRSALTRTSQPPHPEPADAATQRKSRNARRRDDPGRGGQTKDLRISIEIPQSDARLSAGRLSIMPFQIARASS
jgi:hypothetical protein